MKLKPEITKDFLNNFYNVINGMDLENQNNLSVFIPRISNNRFNYDDIIASLSEAIISFVMSRNEILKYEGTPGAMKSRTARMKFRDHASNEGELGEVLLYCFLESHLGAPKILSKYELKTAANDYVKGSDGVHLLKISEKTFQLLIGESKMKKTLQDGIAEAFESLKRFVGVACGKLQFENALIESNLIKEAVDSDTFEYLAKILIPKERAIETNLDLSFGVFVGFEFDSDANSGLSNDEHREKMKSEIVDQVKARIPILKKRLSDSAFSGYCFYVYMIPFSDIEKTRKMIIEAVVK